MSRCFLFIKRFVALNLVGVLDLESKAQQIACESIKLVRQQFIYKSALMNEFSGCFLTTVFRFKMKSVCCILVVVSFCLVGALAKTQCEEHRERELKSNTKVKLVPKCDANGDYEALQCFEGSPFCMCWRPDGSHITDPSKHIKTCVCHVHRDREVNKSKKGLIGNFVPRCEEDGTYSRKQCHGSTGLCWCADENGKKVSEPVRGKLDC